MIMATRVTLRLRASVTIQPPTSKESVRHSKYRSRRRSRLANLCFPPRRESRSPGVGCNMAVKSRMTQQRDSAAGGVESANFRQALGPSAGGREGHRGSQNCPCEQHGVAEGAEQSLAHHVCVLPSPKASSTNRPSSARTSSGHEAVRASKLILSHANNARDASSNS